MLFTLYAALLVPLLSAPQVHSKRPPPPAAELMTELALPQSFTEEVQKRLAAGTELFFEDVQADSFRKKEDMVCWVSERETRSGNVTTSSGSVLCTAPFKRIPHPEEFIPRSGQWLRMVRCADKQGDTLVAVLPCPSLGNINERGVFQSEHIELSFNAPTGWELIGRDEVATASKNRVPSTERTLFALRGGRQNLSFLQLILGERIGGTNDETEQKVLDALAANAVRRIRARWEPSELLSLSEAAHEQVLGSEAVCISFSIKNKSGAWKHKDMHTTVRSQVLCIRFSAPEVEFDTSLREGLACLSDVVTKK